ncbi:uncharacterized protein [Panulirus ornatus]|uniref:uncharacterized protein n=1 Tax=Panulirus ornatus TaxID=150431 RepID=UPI003A84F693
MMMMEVESSDCLDSEENRNGSDEKEIVDSGSGECENEVKELGSSSNEDSYVSQGQKPEDKENGEDFREEEADRESEPEFFNMEDFEVVDVAYDEEDDQEIQCTSPSQITDSREDTSKARIRHGQHRRSENGRSHKHQNRRDRPHRQKDSSRLTKDGRRSSSGPSRSHKRGDSKEKFRKASSKDRTTCDQDRSLSEKSSDKGKHSRASHKQDNKRALDKERCSRHRSGHRKQDRHHLDNKRKDDKKVCVKEGGSEHKKKESPRIDDKLVNSQKLDKKKSCHQDQTSSDKRGSDKCRSDKKIRNKENSNEKNVAKEKQSEDVKEHIEKDNSKLNKGVSDADEASVSSERLSCELTSTTCEINSVICTTSNVSLERNCANFETTHGGCEVTSARHEMTFTGFETQCASHEMTSGISGRVITTSENPSTSFDKTVAACEITGTHCELTGNEDHETIDGNFVQVPKKDDSEKFRCRNNSNGSATSEMLQEEKSTQEDQDVDIELGTKDSKRKDEMLKKTPEDYDLKDFESKRATDSCKLKDLKFEQADTVSKGKQFEHKQAVDDSEQELKSEHTTESDELETPKFEATEYSELKEPKSKQAAVEFTLENKKLKQADKDSRQEDPKFDKTVKDSNWNTSQSEEKTKESKHKDPKAEQLTKDDKQRDPNSVQSANDSKKEDLKSEKAVEVSQQGKHKAVEEVKDSGIEDSKFMKVNVDSGQENKSRQANNSSLQKSSASKGEPVSEQTIAKYEHEVKSLKKQDSELKKEINLSKMKNMKQEGKNVGKDDAECKQETDDVKVEDGIPKQDDGCELASDRDKKECKGTSPQSHHPLPAHYILDHNSGKTEDEIATCSEQTNSSDMKDQISRYIEMIRKEVDEEAKEVEDPLYKKVIGKPSTYRFNKVVIIGDSRIKYLENSDLKKTFDNLEIKCVPRLTIDNLQEAVDLHVMKRKYPQGILLVCSVGIYNIIGFCSNISCGKDHKPMEQVYIKNSRSRSVIGRLKIMRIKLRKMLGKDSEVFFTTILPANIKKFITHQVSFHTETTGHTPVVRSDWSDLEKTVHTMTEKFNHEVMKVSVRKDGKRIPWDPLHFNVSSGQKIFTKQCLENGLDPTKDVTLEYMVPVFQYTLKLYSMNRYQSIVLIGDSRTEVVAKNWPSYKRPMFTILTQPRLCFRNLSEDDAIAKEIMGMKDSLIVISLGLYDFLSYEKYDGCKSHEELEMPCLHHENSDNELWDDFVCSLKKAEQILCKITSNCDVIITTIYPFDFFALRNFEIQRHALATGHVITSNLESSAVDEKMNKIRNLIDRINRVAVTLAKEKQLPVWDLSSLMCDFKHSHSEDTLTLFDGAHPTSDMANRIAEACVSYAEASLCLCCPEFIPNDVKEVACLDDKLFTHISNISSFLESNDFTVPLSQGNDEKESKENSDHKQDCGNKRCKYNKNLISIDLGSSSLRPTPNLENEVRNSIVNEPVIVDKGSDSGKKQVTESSSPSVSLTQPDDACSRKENTTDKQKSVDIDCNSSKSPLHDSVSPTPMGSSPSANVSPFSEISCASSKTSYLESISPASMSLVPSPCSEGKCKEIDEKDTSKDRSHSPSGSCESVTHSSQDRRHRSFKFRRFDRSQSRHFSPSRSRSRERSYSSGRILSSERSDSRKRKHSLSRERSLNRSLSPARSHSAARYRSGDRYFIPEVNYSGKNDISPTRSPSWAGYNTPSRKYSVDREDTYDLNHSTRSCSPARHSSEERCYTSERGYRIHSSRSFTPLGSDRSRELYDSRKNEWQYSPDRPFSPGRGQHSSHTLGASHWENDFGQQGNRFNHNGQHSPSRRDENSRDSRLRSRCPLRKRKRKGCKSKDSITMRALESLREVHVRECDMYRQNPSAHPDYNKEYWAFIEKKAQSILSLGGDPYTYDMSKDWEMFWPNRLQQIFNESWASKRDQCISMLIANRGRSRSPSSFSSDSSLSSSQSSDTRNYPRNYHKKRTKYSKSPSQDRERGIKDRCRSKERMRKKERNRDYVGYYRDKGELKQEQSSDTLSIRNREREKRRDRNDEYYKEAKPSVSEPVQQRNFKSGGRGTTKDLKKTKVILEEAFDSATECVNSGKANCASNAVSWTPLTRKEAAVTGQSSNASVSGKDTMQLDVLADLAKSKRKLGVGNDPLKDKTSSSSGKENPSDLKDFENHHSCIKASPVSLEDSVSESVENAQKVDDFTLHKTKESSEEEVSSTTHLEGVKSDVIDVLEILSRLGERLGALSVPVQLLHEKALELKSSGLDTMKIFDEIDNKILLHMTGDKLRTALKGDNIPIIQKVIIQEGEQRLSLLLEKEKERSLLFDLNIDNIASACLGKSSADTITFIENALLYHGYTEVSKDQLKKIHMAVKKEQFRIIDHGKNNSRSGIINQSSDSPEQPGNLIHQGSLPSLQHSGITPCSSMPSQHSGSAPYSPSQISVSSEDSLPSLPSSPSFLPRSDRHAQQSEPKPVPSPFLNTTGCSRSPVDGRSDVLRCELTVSDCHSALSDATSVGNVAHTTHGELRLKSDFGSFERRMKAAASSSVSVIYDCHSRVSFTSDSKANTMPCNYPNSHGVSASHSVGPNKSYHVQKLESCRSSSKVSSKKPIKITLPKPPAPRVFVRAFNPLGEDESESEES